MIEKIKNFLIHIDLFLVVSIVALIILIPIGFTVDHTHLEKRCNSSPKLYTHSNIADTVPAPIIEFINKSEKIIEIVVSSFHPEGNFTEWSQQLLYAHNRGVEIHVVTDDSDIKNSLSSFCEVTFIENKILVYFAQSDYKHTIYASRLFNDWSIKNNFGFFIDFPDCKSVAYDASSLFSLLKYYAEKGFPEHFLKRFLPGSSFPKIHHWEKGSCSFGIWPPKLIPPGRKSVTTLIEDFFKSPNSNFSIFNPFLFPTLETVDEDMPELLISEQIEQMAYSGSNIRILVLNNSVKSYSVLNSLQHFPNIHVRTFSTNDYWPLFYFRESVVGFIPMTSFFGSSDLTVTFAISIEDEELSAQFKILFDDYWSKTDQNRYSKLY